MAEAARGGASYVPCSGAVLRAPLLAFDVLARMPGALAEARAALRAIVEDAAVREAIFLASPDLDASVATWLAGPDAPEAQAVERSLVRYVTRMAGRATPFGLCSGVGVVPLGARTALELGARDGHRRHLRFDNDYLAAVCAELGRQPEIRAAVRHRPNTSLYRAGGTLRYAEVRHTPGRSFHLVAVEPSDYLVALLERAASGAVPAALAAVLAEDPEVDADEALAFVDELIATQILVPELEPRVTGPEPADRVIGLLAAIPAAAAYAASLRDAADRLAALDTAPLGAPAAGYRAIADHLAGALPVKAPVERLFQADLHLATPGASLGPEVIRELGAAIELLRAIGDPGDDELWTTFRRAFVERYETRAVPLFEVLDDEIGIGLGAGPDAFDAPLLADLVFPAAGEPRRVAWTAREHHLLALVQDAVARGATEIALTDADVGRLSRKTPRPLPPTLAVMASIAAPSAEAVTAGEFAVWVRGLDTPSARMLGRFCHGSDAMTALVAEQLRAEERHAPDAIFAEVVHLPEGRTGNVLLRPLLRDHEIPFLGAGGADPERQIPVSDLMVSVVGDQVVLRSRRLGKRVIPRLTSAHNVTGKSLGVYRFLGSLAAQDGTGGGVGWGAILDAPFLPRIRRGKIVLSRARWILDRGELATLEAAARGARSARTAAELAAIRDRERAALAAVRARRRLPRWIVVSDGDNELPVDLDNPLSVDSAVHLIKGRPAAIVHELYPPPDQMPVRGPDGAYVHELIVPFTLAPDPAHVAAGAAKAAAAARRETTAAPRRFPPGSAWLYAKVYTGAVVADAILREVIGPLARDVIAAGDAERWFFLRFSDPARHLRVRFAGDPSRLMTQVLPRLADALAAPIDAGTVWRVQLDTYEREVERYGGPAAIDLAEQIFAADSDAVLAILDAAAGDDTGQTAWLACLRGIDRLLDDLGLSVADKLRTVTEIRDSFGAEHRLDTDLQRQLGVKFRKHRDALAAVLGAPDQPPLTAVADAIAARSRAIAPLAAELHRLRAAGAIEAPIAELAKSYVHMHVNRVLRSAHRAQEVVLYDLLRRHLDGVVARARQLTTP